MTGSIQTSIPGATIARGQRRSPSAIPRLGRRTHQFVREVAEAALAYAIGDAVEAAYRRGNLFDKRRQLMEAWGGYCVPN